MKPLLLSLATLILTTFPAWSEDLSDLSRWKVEGEVTLDPAQAGPDGKPSLRIPPGSRAALTLRDTDGSGRVSFFVFDDGAVASPGKVKAVGPRWGTSESNGRVCVGGIMYAKFLQPEGSLCVIDTDPAAKGAWLALRFVGPRGKPGWKKWEFDFSPTEGLKLTIDGKAVPPKYFDWNTSKVGGFNGLIFLGDSSPGDGAQTVWISGLDVNLGPAMEVKPGSLPTPTPPPPPVARGPAPEAETEKSTTPPVLARMAGFQPGPRLIDDLRNLKVPLVEGYSSRRPRLLFSADDREALQKRAVERPDLWDAVLASAKGVLSPDGLPAPELIRSGAKYWRIERVQSAALAWFVTGERAWIDGAVRWMRAHARESVWGDTYRPNLDLVASWYLYHIAVAYDILRDQMTEEDRAAIRDGLAEHARYIFHGFDPHDAKEKIRYDQNHTYIPAVAMTAAALALLDETPDASHWLTRGYAVIRRSRYVQSEDGFYYEGFGYWAYALGWHGRGAELLARATGEKLFDIPVLANTWLFGLHMHLPEAIGAYGLGDGGGWDNGVRGPLPGGNGPMLWEVAARTGSAESRTVGDLYFARKPERDFPATAFLWFHPEVSPKPLAEIPPYHYFADHDVVAWRSGWGDDATSYLFRCGPPLGHKAADKLGWLKDWTMNCGHVHPNIGGFWMFAKGAYLAVDTGYTAGKWTRDQNTLLVDEKGQGVDGAYHNERGVPYADLNAARITHQYLSPAYGFARGEFGSAYKRLVPGVELTRSVLMTRRWMLVVDDLEAETPRTLTWLCHSLAEFQPEGAAWVSRQSQAALAVLPLAPAGVIASPEPSMVMGGMAPGRGTLQQRGHKIALRSASPSGETRFINLLVPLGGDEALPEVKLSENAGDRVAFSLRWPNGQTETVRVDLRGAGTQGPAEIVLQ